MKPNVGSNNVFYVHYTTYISYICSMHLVNLLYKP